MANQYVDERILIAQCFNGAIQSLLHTQVPLTDKNIVTETIRLVKLLDSLQAIGLKELLKNEI